MEVRPYLSAIRNANLLEPSISYFGDARLDNKWNDQRSQSPFNRLYMMAEGEAFIHCGDEIILMKPGTAYLVPTGAVIDFWCPSSGRKLYFHFNLLRPDYTDLFQTVTRVMYLPVSPELLTKLHEHGDGGSFADIIAIKSVLYRLLADFDKKYDFASEPFPYYSEHVKDTIDYINANLSATLRLEDLARRCFVSRSFLADRFRKEVGTSIGRYIDDRLIQAALWRLSQTDDSLLEISRDLGFSDQAYFSRRFKQLIGMSPQLYRRRYRIIHP